MWNKVPNQRKIGTRLKGTKGESIIYAILEILSCNQDCQVDGQYLFWGKGRVRGLPNHSANYLVFYLY